MSPEHSKPTVFVVDDDLTFHKLLFHVLKKLGLNTEIFSGSEEFLKRLQVKTPSLCLVDLNFEASKKGFEIIKIIRGHFPKLPIFIVSSTSDKVAIAHALELGANDYLFKPLDRKVLISKLSHYLKSPELGFALPSTPQLLLDNVVRLSATLDVRLQQIDETGMTLMSKHLIPKGTVLSVNGPQIDQIFGMAKHILVTAISSSVEGQEGLFKSYLEFDEAQEGVANQVRGWIQLQKKN